VERTDNCPWEPIPSVCRLKLEQTMKLKRGIRYSLTGQFKTRAGKLYDFDGTIRIAADSRLALAGKLGAPKGASLPTTAGHTAEHADFTGTLVNGGRVEMSGVLLMCADLQLLREADYEYEVRHHAVRVGGIALETATEGSVDVRVEWTLGPSLTIAACGRQNRLIDGDLHETLGSDGLARRSEVKSPLTWQDDLGTLSMALQERKLEQLSEVPNGLAKGYPSRLTFFAPTATFRAESIDAGEVESVVSAAHKWVDELLICMAIIEGQWIPFRERRTTITLTEGRSTLSVWEHRAIPANDEDDPRWQPIRWTDHAMPARVLASMLHRYQEHTHPIDAAVDAWVSGQESKAIESQLVHLIIGVEALKNVWASESPEKSRATDVELSRSERRAVRKDLEKVLTSAGFPPGPAAQMASNALGNRLPFDRVLQNLVEDWQIDVDELWPPPGSPDLRRFEFVGVRNRLVHGQSIREDPIESHFAEVQRLRKFLPLLFEKALRADGLASFMKSMSRL